MQTSDNSRVCCRSIFGNLEEPVNSSWVEGKRKRQLQRGQRKAVLQIKIISQKYENKSKSENKYFKKKSDENEE